MEYVSFFLKDLSFSFVILTVGFIVGWIIYNSIILRGISLKEALFSRDNVAAWIEFIGAFVFPVLYLSGHGLRGSVSDNVFVDLGVCLGYALFYIVILAILRILSQLFVNIINASDSDGKVSLNNEIYTQKNIAAALFSVSLTVVFVSVIKSIDFIAIMNGSGMETLVKILLIVVASLAAFVVYSIVLRRKTTLFKELFIDNNPAAGISLLGFTFAVQTVVTGVISTYAMDFDLITVALVSGFSLIILGILSVLFKLIFTALVKVDIWSEVYEQDNMGAALGQAALYIGIAYIIMNFIM